MRKFWLVAVLALMGSAVHAAPQLLDVATVSMSAPGVPRMTADNICANDGTDLVCDLGVEARTGGLLVATRVSATNVSASVGDFTTLRVGGVPITSGGGGAASPTNVPAFSVHRNGAAQALPINGPNKINFTHEDFDQTNAFDSSTNYRFQPNVPGRYLITVNVSCFPDNCIPGFYKNGSVYTWGASTNFYATVAGVVDLNGSTDYIEGYAYTANTTTSIYAGSRIYAIMSGSLLASGNGLISGSTALGDRITSGTTAMVANSPTGVISITQLGVATAYLHPTLGYVGPGVSTTGTISATSVYAGTNLQLASPTTVVACSSTNAGSLRYNSPTTTLELCTGAGWQPMGVGIPAGTIVALASTTCPTGWSEYTPARGRFLRGIDNLAGNDPDGTRAPGATQADDFKSHTHTATTTANQITAAVLSMAGANYGAMNGGGTVTVNAAGGAETRPKNVAVTFCQFNGTSNGWNNPLSGGAGGTPGGSDTQVQYNSGGAFAGSSGLTFNNAASRLTATNISSSVVEATDTVSTTSLKLSRSSGGCASAADQGRILINATTGRLQMCVTR